MTDAAERIVNLAFFFGNSGGSWVSAEQIRAEVAGYPAGQDDSAFYRMFERDKDELRLAGLSITSTAEGRYRLDTASTFASEIELTASEAAMLRAVGAASLEDPAFPFPEDLRFAMAKISTALRPADSPVVARSADERPEAQGQAVALLDDAIQRRKAVTFGYTNSRGEQRKHRVEPFGIFSREGRWYLVGRDTELAQIRVYAAARMTEASVDSSKPKSPDFDRPADFDITSFVQLPFQYASSDPFEARIAFTPAQAWRAPPVSAGKGVIEATADGGAEWTVEARDRHRLLRWLIENGPGLTPLAPPETSRMLAEGLRSVLAAHEDTHHA